MKKYINCCIKVRILKQCYWFIKAKDVHYQKQRSILTSSTVVTVVGKIPTTTAVGTSSIKMERLNISLIKMTLEYIQLHLAVPNGLLSSWRLLRQAMESPAIQSLAIRKTYCKESLTASSYGFTYLLHCFAY